MSGRLLDGKPKVKQSRLPISTFVIIFLILLLMSGIHEGLIVFINYVGVPSHIQAPFPVLYWACVAIGLCIFIGYRIKKTYEEPMQMLAKATASVAAGDFSVYVAPLHTEDRLDYLDVMLMDFNKMVAELGSIETLKTDFFSNVSHEIKTPIAVIQNNAEMLHREQISEEQRMEYTENILLSTKRLTNLITNMLKLNKLEKQTIHPKPEKYNLCEQLRECALQFEDIWEKKEIDFEVDIEEHVYIVADSGLLELVWTNLLSNALKFTQSGGTVLVSQRTWDNKVSISITDNGCGMKEETLKRIFDQFYQGDTSHSTEGNGLGLALVQRILELSDGTISVESEIGKGTTFTVQLPANIN